MKFLKSFFVELYRKKRSVFFSIVLAFIAWIMTIICTDRYSVIVIKNVPVVANLTNTQAEQLGFDVVKINPKTVSVKLKGPRHKIGMFPPDDIFVTFDSSKNVTSSGDHEKMLTAELKQFQPDITIDKIEPKSAIVTFDQFDTKLVDVICDLSNVQAEEGFILDEPVCQPKSLYVSGPRQVLENLKAVQLSAKFVPKILNSSKTFEADKKFISNEGKELDGSLLKYDETKKFNVTVPVYRLKQVPLTVMLKNAPSCFNLNLLKNCMTITPTHIDVGVPNEIDDGLKEINIGYIDVRELDLDANDDETKFSFAVSVPVGCKNISQVNSAQVLFDTKNWGFKTFSVDEVQLTNLNENYEVKVVSSVLEKVKIIGFKNQLSSLTKDDITAKVDLSGYSLKAGKQTVPVTIGVLKDGVWPKGRYTCCVSARKL